VLAVKAGQNGRMRAPSRLGSLVPAGGLVLPRWLRRPVRLMTRLTSGDVEPPRFAATIASAVLIGSASLYGAYLGGHMPEMVKSVTARSGFAVDEIRITGNAETSEIDVFERIGLDGWTSLVGFDAGEARERIMSLPWVEQASVRKIYPAGLDVEISEKHPFAIWQQGSRLILIEEDGAVIAPLVGARHAKLPLVTGRGAAENAAPFIARVAAHPELASRVRGYVRVSERRWNLILENGVAIKLPEHGVDKALGDIVELDRAHGILSRDIASVDMRLGDRLVVRLSPEAATAREAALKERLGKAYKPREQRI
jgi:cell division protein FtsQ